MDADIFFCSAASFSARYVSDGLIHESKAVLGAPISPQRSAPLESFLLRMVASSNHRKVEQLDGRPVDG